MLATLYFIIALITAIGTLSALVKARQIYFLALPYFILAWLTGELALVTMLWQFGLTAVLAAAGVLDDSLAQCALALFSLSWLGMAYLHFQAMDTDNYIRRALRRSLGDNYRLDIPVHRQHTLKDGVRSGSWLKPFQFEREGVRKHRGISYGEAGVRNLLDIYQPGAPSERPRPVLLQVHGGAWIVGHKEEQAKPLMYHLAQRDWVCVSINYRLSPVDKFPAHIIDVKKAIAWVRDNIADYGGDPEFIAITGGSAGGHLSALAALTANDSEYQPGFEDRDTTVQAAVPFYGVYDFLDRDNIRPAMPLEDFLGDKVMPCSPFADRELWDRASPLSRINADAPPFFVIQGTHDSLVWVEEARNFVASLQAQSKQKVAYAELPGAQHAFDMFHSVRTDHTVNGVADFLEWSHGQWLADKAV